MITNIGIGFVTGRKHFQDVLRTYINNWLEHGILQDENIRLYLFVAYDLKYQGTEMSDYKNIPPELAKMVASINFFGTNRINSEIALLRNEGKLDENEAQLLFGDGYSKKRNAVTYFAIKHKMDRLIFIDDDEYPLATVKNDKDQLMWMGQSVVGTHLKYIADADITHGHHCGYISPIPFIRFNNILSENDFRHFIEAISNDVINWVKVRHDMLHNKGVTYASSVIINQSPVTEVQEENGMKFISGANLCFNLANAKRLPPFYNPPGARGEDTFMSTALSNLKVLKVPCYTFHDAFSTYNNLVHGVLPIHLEPIDSISPTNLKRFIAATIGWVQYKPLMVYITNREEYNRIMELMAVSLRFTIPKLCAYFKTDEFEKIMVEFELYKKNVVKHFNDFEATKVSWTKLMCNMN